MKKILFITHSYSMSGGAEDEFERLLKYFSNKKDQYEIHGLFPNGPRAIIYSRYCVRSGTYKYGHLPVIYENFFDYVKYILKSVIQSLQIFRFAIGQKYELTVINVVVLLWPALTMRIMGSKVVVFIREDIYPVKLRNFIYRLLSKTCTFFIPNSVTKEKNFTAVTGDNRIKHIYPGIEDQIGHDFCKLSGTVGDKLFTKLTAKGIFKIVNPAGVFRKKNQFLILKALKELQYSGLVKMPNVFFVGYYDESSSYYKMLMEYIRRHSLEEYLFFLGPLERSVLYELYNLIDVVVLSSLSEGMPIVMIESLKFGKPFVSTKVGGVPEIIKNNINGFLIDFDEKQLSKVILQLMNDKRLYDKVNTKAFSTYEQNFNLIKSLNEIEAIFQKVINESK